MKVGDIFAFEDEGRAIYGQIISLEPHYAILIDPNAFFYRVNKDKLLAVGQSLADGTVLMTSSRIAYDVKTETDTLLRDGFVRMTIKHLARSVPRHSVGFIGKGDDAQQKPSTVERSWEIPLKLCILNKPERSGLRWTAQFEGYITSSEPRKRRFEGVLRRLRERAPIQHRLYLACEVGGMSQADACRLYALKSSNVSVQLRKAIAFVDAAMGTNVLGVNA